MKWTKEVPIRDGYYWALEKDNNVPIIVVVSLKRRSFSSLDVIEDNPFQYIHQEMKVRRHSKNMNGGQMFRFQNQRSPLLTMSRSLRS
jgi:hypothetical protein